MRVEDGPQCGATISVFVENDDEPLPVYCDQPFGHPSWHSAFAGASANRVQWTESDTEATQTETFAELVGQGADATGVAHPGDIIVFSTADQTAPHAARLRSLLLGRLPGIADIVVVPGLRLEAIYRPEPADG